MTYSLKRWICKSKLLASVTLLLCLAPIATDAALCPYLGGATFIGRIDHCYTVSKTVSFQASPGGVGGGGSVTTTRSYCVYGGIVGSNGIDYSGQSKTIPKAQANLC